MIYEIKTSGSNLITEDEDDMRNFIAQCLDELESGDIYFLNIKASSHLKKKKSTPSFWND